MQQIAVFSKFSGEHALYQHSPSKKLAMNTDILKLFLP